MQYKHNRMINKFQVIAVMPKTENKPVFDMGFNDAVKFLKKNYAVESSEYIYEDVDSEYLIGNNSVSVRLYKNLDM